MNACFSAVPHLKSVVFPEKLRTIEHSSFVNCRSLEEIVFPECNDKMYIGNSAFHGTNVKTLKLPNGLKSIEYYTFSGNYNLEELHLPQNDQLVIDISAFYNCPNLKIIYCPNIIPPTTDDQLYGYDYLEDPTRRFLTEFCSPDYYRNIKIPKLGDGRQVVFALIDKPPALGNIGLYGGMISGFGRCQIVPVLQGFPGGTLHFG